MSLVPPPGPIDPSTDSRPSLSCVSPLPKLEFPKFDGENPHLWKDRCDLYFEVYSVSDYLKLCFVTLNFIGVEGFPTLNATTEL